MISVFILSVSATNWHFHFHEKSDAKTVNYNDNGLRIPQEDIQKNLEDYNDEFTEDKEMLS